MQDANANAEEKKKDKKELGAGQRHDRSTQRKAGHTYKSTLEASIRERTGQPKT